MPIVFLLLLHEARSGTGRYLRPTPATRGGFAALLAGGLLALVAAGLYAASVDWSHALVNLMLTLSFVLLFGAGLLIFARDSVRVIAFNWTAVAAIGLWLQTVMLLLREEGLDSCPQEAWAVYSPQIREVVAIPQDHTFFCALAIGYRDPDAPVNQFPVARAPLGEAVRWEGWE